MMWIPIFQGRGDEGDAGRCEACEQTNQRAKKAREEAHRLRQLLHRDRQDKANAEADNKLLREHVARMHVDCEAAAQRARTAEAESRLVKQQLAEMRATHEAWRQQVAHADLQQQQAACRDALEGCKQCEQLQNAHAHDADRLQKLQTAHADMAKEYQACRAQLVELKLKCDALQSIRQQGDEPSLGIASVVAGEAPRGCKEAQRRLDTPEASVAEAASTHPRWISRVQALLEEMARECRQLLFDMAQVARGMCEAQAVDATIAQLAEMLRRHAAPPAQGLAPRDDQVDRRLPPSV
jgi:hypothetical protein